jgi:hypothetical protein
MLGVTPNEFNRLGHHVDNFGAVDGDADLRLETEDAFHGVLRIR